MSNNNFGYGENYPPASNRAQTSQSSHQNYPTSNVTTAPYYGLQSTETAGKTYASNYYQDGQYGQAATSSANNLDNWGNYRNTTATGTYSTGSLESVEQRLLNATRAPAQSNYDSSNLSNLGYGSNLAYGTAAETAQPGSDYSSTNTAGAHDPEGSLLPASQGQRQAETTPRTSTTASYNSPTPSPTYPQGLMNSYPGNAASASLARAATASNTRTKETTTAQTSAQQPSYTQNTSYGYTQQQQQARARLSPEQMRKTQTPTPPVPPIRMATPETKTAASSAKAYYQQPAQTNATQGANQPRARTQPASSMKTAPVNVIMPSVGQPQTSPKRAPAGQRDMYQPQQPSVSTAVARSIENFRSDPSRASSTYQQQQTQSRSEPAQDQPTSVDPSLVYNRYHEYQQQIKEAEAEAARLAKIEEEKKAAEEAEKRKAEAAKKKEEAEAARIEKQRKQQEAKAAREAKAAEKARQTAEKARKRKEAEEAAAAAARAATEAARTLAQDMHHQTKFGMNAPQEVQAGEGEESEEYMEVQAGDNQDEDYVEEQQQQQQQQRPPNQFQQQQQQQRGTPAHKPILPPQCQSTPQSRPPPQQNTETPANDADLTAMMEEEMRKTVERLRDFQAKEPKLFLKVWSSVRKSGTGPGQSPQPNGEGSQAQQSPAMGSAGMQPSLSYGAGPSNQGNAYQNDGSQPQQPPSVPTPVPKKRRVRKPKQSLEAQTAATQNQKHQPQNLDPQLQAQAQAPQQQQFRGFADDFHTGEVVAPGESIMMQTENAQQPPRKRKPGRPSNAEKALREMQQTNEPPPVKRAPGRPKGSKTKKKLAEGEVVDEDPIPAPPTPPMQPAGPGSFGRLVPSAPSALAAERAACNEQSQQSLQANNGPFQSAGRVLNAGQPSPSITAASGTSQPPQGQQSGPSPAPRSATTATIEQGKAAPIAASASVQNQTAQWPDEHIDLIADTGSKLLNSLPQNVGKTMESSTIRDMLRTNPSYVQVCEMIESKGFYMDRSKFARTLLAVISPNHPTPAKQGQQQPQASVVIANSGASGSQQNVGSQPRTLSSAAAAMRAHKEGLLPNALPHSQPPQPEPSQRQPKQAHGRGCSRPYQVYQPPKYGELGTRPVQEGSFVREDTTPSQGPTQSTQPTMEEKAEAYALPYQDLRPDESDDFVPAPMDEDDRDDEQQLSLLKAYNQSTSTQNQTPTPYGNQQNQTTSSGAPHLANGQPAQQGTYLGNGVWRHPSVNGQDTPSHSTSQYPYQSQFSARNAPASASQTIQGRPPQPSHIVPSQNTPSARVLTPIRPWGKPTVTLTTGGDSALKRPHSEAFGSMRPLASQPSSSFRPNPFGGSRNNSASEMPGARATSFTGASPFRVSSTTPQPQMPTLASNKTFQSLYSQPYLQVNSIEESSPISQQNRAKNPLLNFDDIVLPIDTSLARRRTKEHNYDPKTIARDVLIAAGKIDRPLEKDRALNAHLLVLQRLFKAVNNKSDLSTFRWDIVDPGGEEVGSFNKELKEKMAARRGAVPSRGNPFGMSSRPKTPSGLRNETLEIEDDDAMDDDDEEYARQQSMAHSGAAPGRPGRQARNPAPNYKGMSAAELRGLKHDAGRRYREDSEQTPSEAAREPRKGLKYVEFACKWEGCNHVLLNLATLKRHIFTLHGSNDDVVHPGKVCMWHGCGNKDYSAEHDETPGTHFDKLKDFKQHMEDTHLKSVARLYGDGPKSDVYDNDSDFGSSAASSYLFSENGRQVTPSVHAGQDIVRDKAEYIEAKRVHKMQREQRRKDHILTYWNIENFESYPVKLNASPSTGGLIKEALGRYLRAQRQLEEEYGDELAEATKLNEGMSETSKKRVYDHNMPKELKRKLGLLS